MGRRNGARVVFVEVCGQTGNLTQLKHPVCFNDGQNTRQRKGTTTASWRR